MRILRFGVTLGLGLFLVAGLTAPSPAPIAWSDMADPTADEQYVLEVINRARANPIAEGVRLGLSGGIGENVPAANLPFLVPKPPLAMSAILHQTATDHSVDMWTNAYFAHNTLGGVTPDQRATNAGYLWNTFGENIAAATSETAAQLEDDLMIDSSVPDRGHRLNLLSIYDDATFPVFREIGVGYYHGPTPQTISGQSLQDFMTEDFGRRDAVGPFLVGVVWDDTGGVPFYTQGKGLGGVTISLSPAGTYFATTASAGGYSFPVGTSGTVIVTCSGGKFTSTVYKAVNLTGENVKVDFKLSDMSIVDADHDGLPDSWEILHFGSISAYGPADDPDGDGANNIAEFNAGTDPMDPNSKPVVQGPPAGGTTTTTKSGGGGGGGCGLLGLEGLLALGFLRRRRS